MGNILEVKNFSKSYGEIKALDNFNLDVKEGEIYGLLGPNGAGKTTLISAIAGLLKGYNGSINFMGRDIFSDRALKNHLGIVPQNTAFYEELGAYDNLLFWGGFYGISAAKLKERAKSLLKDVDLIDRANEKVKNFSGGMKRRLNIAIGLIHKPRLLLLDEPTVGIDVQAKVRILEIIENAGKNGTAVVFTTHQLAEVEQVCSMIGIMDKGRIIASGTLDELKKIVGEKDIVEIYGEFDTEILVKMLKTGSDYDLISAREDIVTLAFSDRKKLPAVLEKFFKRGIGISEIKIKSPNLESVFLKLTGRSLRD